MTAHQRLARKWPRHRYSRRKVLQPDRLEQHPRQQLGRTACLYEPSELADVAVRLRPQARFDLGESGFQSFAAAPTQNLGHLVGLELVGVCGHRGTYFPEPRQIRWVWTVLWETPTCRAISLTVGE